MRWTVGIIVVFLVVLLVAGELFLPWVVARGVETGLARTLGSGTALEVSLGVRPSLRMLLGRLDTLTVESQRVKTATLTVDSISVTIRDIAINLQDLLAQRLDISRSPAIGAVISISEGNLRRYVLDNIEGLSEPQFKVFDGKAALAGYMRFGTTPVLISAEGRFVAADEHKVLFVVDTLSLDGERMPARMAETILSALGGPELFIDIRRFPVPLAISEVKMRDGWLIIEAATPVR